MNFPATESARPSITVIAVGAVKHTLPEIARAFSEQFDCKVELSFNTAGVTRSKVEADDGADTLVTVAEDLPAMRQKALIGADRPVELGVMRMGMAIRTGDKAPDIATPAAFKRALEQARSISYANPASGASSGVHFDALLGRLNVDDSVRKKSVLTRGGLAAIQAVVERKSDLGFTVVSEIRGTKGVRNSISTPTIRAACRLSKRWKPAVGSSSAISIRRAKPSTSPMSRANPSAAISYARPSLESSCLS